MGKLTLILSLAPWLMYATCMEALNDTELPANSSDPHKDMYVINAMVYQVGILTNKTDNETANINATSGKQETVTFFHNKGSQVDLSKIAAPLLTNVTAQSMVAVAPVPAHADNVPNHLPWSTLKHLTNMQHSADSTDSEQKNTSKRSIRSLGIMDSDTSLNKFYKSLFKRDVPVGSTPVSIHSGSAVVPQGAGVQSIALPPLLTLNNNLSDIPVPIPNTSVVHYAKINTLVSKP